MKKLFLAVALVAASFSASAADKTWNFTSWTLGNQAFPTHLDALGAIVYESVTIDGLGITSNLTNPNAGAISANSKTIGGVSFTIRCQTNGGGYSTTTGVKATPTQRFLSFKVDGNSAIKVYFISGSGTAAAPAPRSAIISDGTTVLAELVDQSTGSLLEYSYVGGPKVLYVYGDAAINIYQINATNVNVGYVAASKDAISSDLLKLAGETLVNPTNLAVEVYSVAGVKVLSSSDASINVSGLSGAFVAKTAEGTLKFVK